MEERTVTTTPVSAVIPVYNERTRLPGTLARLAQFQIEWPALREILIVDDGSLDRIDQVVAEWQDRLSGLRLISYRRNSGKGYAIRRGVLESNGDFVLITDADLSTPIEELLELCSVMPEYDVVIGSRALHSSRIQVRQPWYRQAMGRMFNRLMRLITGLPFHDTQCGFKLLRRPCARTIFETASVDRFAWDVEMLMLACRLRYRVAEVPVRWDHAPESRVRIVRDSFRMLWDTLRLRMRLGRARCAHDR